MNGSVHEAILTSGADFNHFGGTGEIPGKARYRCIICVGEVITGLIVLAVLGVTSQLNLPLS